MSFKDYSATPSGVTTIGDAIYVGPNMARDQVRPALQQLAADGRQLWNIAESGDTWLYTSQAAGEAATSAGDVFRHPDERGRIIYRERTSTGSTVIAVSDQGASYPTLAALADGGDTAAHLDNAFLAESGKEGVFVFSTANLSAKVALDTAQGKYVAKANDPTGSTGAWVRESVGVLQLKWFHQSTSGGDYTAAIRTMLAVAESGDKLSFSSGVRAIGISDDGGGDSEALFPITTHGLTLEMDSFGKDQTNLGCYFKLLGNISKSIFKLDGSAGAQPSGHTIDLSFSGYINGTTRYSVAGFCVLHKAADFVTYRRLTGHNIAGGLLKCIRAVKCHFQNINSQTCGATGYSAVELAGTSSSIGTQGSSFVNVRIENTVNAEGLKIAAHDRANKFFGLTFEATGGIVVGDFSFITIDGYNNQFFGLTLGHHEGLTSAKAKLQDNGIGNQFFGVGCTIGNTHRTTGDEINLAGSRTIVSGVQGIANASVYETVLVRTAAASLGVTVNDLYAYQCNPLAMGGAYGSSNNVKTQLARGTAVVVGGSYNEVTNIEIVAAFATAAPVVQITGTDCIAKGRIVSASAASTATAGVHATSAAQRAQIDFDVDGSCTALGHNYIAQGIWCEANDANIKARVRRVGQNAIRYGNTRVGSCFLERCESWGLSAANTYAAVEKTEPSMAYGGTIRVGNLYPPSGTYAVAQSHWLKVIDNTGQASWQSIFARCDCAPGLTASITAHASNVIEQGVA